MLAFPCRPQEALNGRELTPETVVRLEAIFLELDELLEDPANYLNSAQLPFPLVEPTPSADLRTLEQNRIA
jgi:hypothetical protein